MIVYNYFYLEEYKLPTILFMIKKLKKAAKERCKGEKKEAAKKKA